MLKTPQFWKSDDLPSKLLTPFAWLYRHIANWRESRVVPQIAGIPVICVGNLVMGGAGKTPVVMAITKMLREMGHNPHIISRGYGGYYREVALVEPSLHTYLQVGDEPLLLAKEAPTWIGVDRVEAAKEAKSQGATVIVMDDGLQNPSLKKDLSILVVDSLQGLGNKKVFPAGPLREPIEQGIKRADLVIIVGDSNPFPEVFKEPVMAKIVSDESKLPEKVVAFAGIGYPEKFRLSLCAQNIDVVEFIPFADHYPYTITDIQRLVKISEGHECKLMTTEKDYLRVPPAYRSKVSTFKIHLEFGDVPLINEKISQVFNQPNNF